MGSGISLNSQLPTLNSQHPTPNSQLFPSPNSEFRSQSAELQSANISQVQIETFSALGSCNPTFNHQPSTPISQLPNPNSQFSPNAF